MVSSSISSDIYRFALNDNIFDMAQDLNRIKVELAEQKETDDCDSILGGLYTDNVMYVEKSRVEKSKVAVPVYYCIEECEKDIEKLHERLDFELKTLEELINSNMVSLSKIEISQEDYDFIKTFISEYVHNEEEKKLMYAALDVLKDQEEDEETRIVAALFIYCLFSITVYKIGEIWSTLSPDAEEPLIRISPTCDELYGMLILLSDIHIQDVLSSLNCESCVFDCLYTCIRNRDPKLFRTTIYSCSVSIHKAGSKAFLYLMTTSQFWFVLREEKVMKPFISDFLDCTSIGDLWRVDKLNTEKIGKALSFAVFSIEFILHFGNIEQRLFVKTNAPHFSCLIKNISKSESSFFKELLEEPEQLYCYMYSFYKSHRDRFLPHLTEHEVKAETDNSLEQVQCGGDPDLFKKRLQNKRHQKIVISQFLVGWFDILDNSKDLNYYISAIFFGSDGGNLLSPALRYKKAKWELVCFVSYLYKENVPKNVWEHLNKYICDKNGNSLFNDKNPSSAATSEKKQQVKRNIIKCIQDHINRPLNKEEKEDIGDE